MSSNTTNATLQLSLLHLDNGATLAFHPCPGKDGTPQADIAYLIDQGPAAVVSLVEQHELDELKVSTLGQQLQQAHIHWFHLPIGDDAAPNAAFEAAWAEASPALHELLDAGQLVTVHCRGGTGRTGLVIARLLLERGYSLDEATAAVQQIRPKALTLPVHQHYISELACKLCD